MAVNPRIKLEYHAAFVIHGGAGVEASEGQDIAPVTMLARMAHWGYVNWWEVESGW
jgi:hypothetical protein